MKGRSVFCLFGVTYLVFLPLFLSSVEQDAVVPREQSLLLDSTHYALPQTHPFKSTVNFLFADPNVLQDEISLSAAGFITHDIRKRNSMRVVSHPSVPGYLFKLFLRSETSRQRLAWQRDIFIDRCKSARILQKVIRINRMKHFVVPSKWLIEVKTRGFHTYVLMVTKINVLNTKRSERAWKTRASSELLQELHTLLQKVQISPRLASNLPYTKEGKFAFIDTERRTYDFDILLVYLSRKMQKYWSQLISSVSYAPLQETSLQPNEENEKEENSGYDAL